MILTNIRKTVRYMPKPVNGLQVIVREMDKI